MKFYNHHELVIPPDSELCIYLIKEELKSWKFFNAFYQLGLGGNQHQTDLGPVILTMVGLDIQCDEVLDFYCSLIEKHSYRMEATTRSMVQHAVLVYNELESSKFRI